MSSIKTNSVEQKVISFAFLAQKAQDYGMLVKLRLTSTVVFSSVMAYLIASAEAAVNWPALLILATGWAAYYFHFEQVFVKRWGGVMTIKVPDGQYHIATTWKEDNLWVENYDPETDRCIFSEYSKGNLLQGRVTIKNCNPLMRQ